MSDIWQDLRSFSDSKGHVPKHERWRWLKDLSHRIGLEEHPDPYWEFLKTQIVREVCLGGEDADFTSGGRISLDMMTQSVTRGLRWGDLSVSHMEYQHKESQWYLYGEAQTSEDLALRGFEGYRDPAQMARDAVQRGIPWSLNLAVVAETDVGLRAVFYLPIGVGFLHDPEGEVERAWLEGLKKERQLLRQSISGPMHQMIQREILRHCPDVDFDWASVIASYPPYHIQIEEEEQGILSSLRRNTSRRDQYLHALEIGARLYRDIFSFGVPAATRRFKDIFSEDPRCKVWKKGVARSWLCDHALDAFIAQDRRGRSILRDFLAQNP